MSDTFVDEPPYSNIAAFESTKEQHDLSNNPRATKNKQKEAFYSKQHREVY